MAVKIIRKSETTAREISKTYTVTNFLTKNLCKDVSLAVSQATNHSETTKNIKSDRVYYVLKGKLIVNKEIVAEPGDVIFIPKNTEYSFEGTFKAVLVNSPAFNPQDEKISKL